MQVTIYRDGSADVTDDFGRGPVLHVLDYVGTSSGCRFRAAEQLRKLDLEPFYGWTVPAEDEKHPPAFRCYVRPIPFVAYRDRPALDKGEVITWRELESGMLFEPGVSAPTRRRVRGTPRHIEDDGSYLVGSEDLDGCPKGGIVGTDADHYRRTFDDLGRPVYVIDYAWSMG